MRILRRMGWLLGAVMFVLMIPAPARATSPYVAQLATFFTRYHEDPPRLDVIRAGLETAVKTDPDVPNLLALAQVCFIWGDIRATTEEEKLQAYDRGRNAAERVVELEPKNVLAHLWFAINTARWGQTKGVVRSLFLLPTVKREINTILELDPELPPAYSLAGNVYYEVPGPLGGDLGTAERMFRKGLELDPRFTSLRIGLAKVLIKQGRLAEARQELQGVLDEKHPESPADWTMKDSTRARALLDTLNRTS
ncbi:MAG TPA: tetratricopeptide repeat protein [Candidatus Methylomirabilis sp.]|nr:tetratricopeptide repeat protein [Candidatus Methylomirabilis sp.]